MLLNWQYLTSKQRLDLTVYYKENSSKIKVEDYATALFFNMLFASLHFFVPVICSRTIQIVGGQHAHFALNLNMFIAGLIQILIPGGVEVMVPDNSREQWSVLFYIVAAIIVFTTSLYLFCTKFEAAEWSKEKKTNIDSESYSETLPKLKN
uniref:MFS domain-containing protein n=1 Tax=Heterorhabditis bacteriophora TaxID=37862 RepID=A0A1I7XLW2_HETBA